MEAVVRFLLQHPAAAMRIRRGLEDPITPTTNDDMVNGMQMEGSLTDARCVEAFRQVDRMLFAPESEKMSAYAPMPLREGTIHLSAPPIYAEASESLMPITPGMSFLNIGSGTGYFNSIIAYLQYSEPYISTNHGIEIWPQTVSYCQEKVKQYSHAVNCEFFQGNIYELDVKNSMMYDRIYVGACASSKSKYLYELLEVGGILVGPFQTSTGAQQLRRVTRVSQREFRTEVLKSVSFASLVEPDYSLSDDHRQFTYALPERAWSTERHASFPPSFREAVMTTLLSVRQSSILPLLPKEIWIQHIFHWCRRHWFDADNQSNGSHKAPRKSLSSTGFMSPAEKKQKIAPPLTQARKLDSTPAMSPASSSSKHTNVSADVAAEPPASGLSAPSSSSSGPSVPPVLRAGSALLGPPTVFRASAASSYSGSVSAPTTVLPTEVPTTLPTDVSASSGAEVDGEADSDENRGKWTEPPENIASSPNDGVGSAENHDEGEKHDESEKHDEVENSDEGENEGIVEVFEDGRRHLIGQADDPDDLAPDDMAGLVGGLIPIEMAHFIALAALERENRRRREVREEMPDDDAGDARSASNPMSASDDEDLEAGMRLRAFGYLHRLAGDSESESVDEPMQGQPEPAQQGLFLLAASAFDDRVRKRLISNKLACQHRPGGGGP
eukprot:GEMP01007073.1.p1 GENE.GEMP01007073.1~~GEMP01007073.1.p1  ORF type:complete len:669 (+),score=154.38 GEMP01007073.1:118-2124(+)